jgi:rare lipoprotein A (peptidoglycan hydrolase)
VRLLRRTTLTAALVAALLGVPGHGAGAAPAPDLAELQAQLAQATARADALSLALESAAAADGGLRVALERLAQQHDDAQARLDARVRQVWISRKPDPMSWVDGLGSPALRRLAHRGASAAVTVDRQLVEAVSEQSETARALRAQAKQRRVALRAQAAGALEAQDTARQLLAQAEQLLAQQAAATVQQAERDRLAALGTFLATSRASLDVASATVTRALTPAQTRRSRRAQVQEAPLVALVEAAGGGYPAGYAPTGQVLRGLASWYGPGFVGSPTASGSPYDPERLTCAHKSLRLGTVVRVSANGRAVSCLVNDRGPYVEPRILDLSRAGSRALGFDGVQEVVVEILTPR